MTEAACTVQHPRRQRKRNTDKNVFQETEEKQNLVNNNKTHVGLHTHRKENFAKLL
jgi:hypothetical protein